MVKPHEPLQHINKPRPHQKSQCVPATCPKPGSSTAKMPRLTHTHIGILEKRGGNRACKGFGSRVLGLQGLGFRIWGWRVPRFMSVQGFACLHVWRYILCHETSVAHCERIGLFFYSYTMVYYRTILAAAPCARDHVRAFLKKIRPADRWSMILGF